ncbi:MAG: hypothetical protein JSR48_14480 [Verrucomicrobia bacterium]|nr:hypothetical protein [Verrucomicrobiota bacterium]
MAENPALPDRIRHTAANELAAIFATRTAPDRVVLGLLGELPAARELAARGLVSLGTVPPGEDAFSVLHHDGTLWLLGTTPRGVLQAVFALHGALEAGEVPADGFKREGRFRFSQRIFHARFQPWPGEAADVRYLAHLGASHCLVSHDWQGSRRSLQGYVTSPVFPGAVPPKEVAENHAGLRRLLDACADFGLGAMLWLTELPCQGGPWLTDAERAGFLERFPAEVLSESGTYEGRVLCFSHPRVQDFYRDLLARFFADFPEIETLFVFGQDSGGEFCDPDSCPRCRGLSRIAQRDRLIRFLADEGRRVRPGLRVLTTGWGWDSDSADFLRRQAALPAASGLYLAAQKDGWQCERQNHDFLAAAGRCCRDHGQVFIGYDNLHWGDDSVHRMNDIQDYPFGIAAKLRRWHALGADGVFDHWGASSEDLWINSVACREFFLDPTAEPAPVIRRIAEREFGPEAAALVVGAWQSLERAQARLSDACTWAPGQWPAWYHGRAAGPIPAARDLDELRRTQLPPRPAGEKLYNPPDFAAALQAVADAWHDALPHLAESASQLARAEGVVEDGPLHHRFWWNGAAASPDRREHLRRQRRYVESTAAAGREIGLQFGLYARWVRLNGDPEAYRTASAAEMRELTDACHAAAEYFGAVGQPPQWAEDYAAKAARFAEFLK